MIALLLMMVGSNALAIEGELSVHAAGIANNDRGLNQVLPSGGPLFGVRAGISLHERFAVIADWGASVDGVGLSFGDHKVSSSYTQHQLGLGPKVNVKLGNHGPMRGYLTVQGVLGFAEMRLDDDSQTINNPGQLSFNALSPGGFAALGAEVRPPKTLTRAVRIGGFMEMGWTVRGALDLGALGEVQPGGFTARTGLSLLF